MNSIRSKEKILAKTKEREDPREGAPAIKAAIQELHQRMSVKVHNLTTAKSLMLQAK